MKKIVAVFTLLSFVCCLSFGQSNVAKEVAAKADIEKAVEGPNMEFAETQIDYGVIKQGSEPLRQFTFVNTGTEPLIIKNARGSCGCTVPSYPHEPIMPGEEGTIDVRYDTKRIGKFSKTVTLTTNEPGEKRVIRISGEVLRQEAPPEAVPSKKADPFKTNG